MDRPKVLKSRTSVRRSGNIGGYILRLRYPAGCLFIVPQCLHHSNGHDFAVPVQISSDALLVRAAEALLESNAVQHGL